MGGGLYVDCRAESRIAWERCWGSSRGLDRELCKWLKTRLQSFAHCVKHQHPLQAATWLFLCSWVCHAWAMWRFPRHVPKKQLSLRKHCPSGKQPRVHKDSFPPKCAVLSCPPHPSVWNNPFSPLLGFWHLNYAWPLVLFFAFPGTVKDAKGVISTFPVTLKLIAERLEVERTPMRSSLTSPGSNPELFLRILLSGALSSSAVT